MMPRLIATCALAFAAAVLSVGSAAQETRSRVPKFVDYPVAVIKGAKPLRLDRDDMTFRTRYRELYETGRTEGANFAGHYALTAVGCGSGGCVFLLVIDLQTGKTVHLDVPAGEELSDCSAKYRDRDGEPIYHRFYFRPDSRLFVVTGRMQGLECGARYFVERNGWMVHLRDVPLEENP